MRTHSMIALSILLLAPTALAATAEGSTTSVAATGQVVVVQAVPDASIEVSIDGRPVETRAETGDVLGPYGLAPGSHRIDFTGPDISLATTVEVQANSSQDVVVHLPASLDGDPVVNSYRTPTKPIGHGKARVLVAHTATVAPADVVVDGTAVFTNIANGEFATADVPAGKHVVELLPTGETENPILGPLDVTLTPGTITMVYAIGDPADESMQLVAHSARLTGDGSVAPGSIETGSAGLVSGIAVHTFGPRRSAVTR